jgi:hypothetical protein
MAKKKTSSDIMKSWLHACTQVAPSNWKRVSKKKDDDGNWVREFKEPNGTSALVIEKPDETVLKFPNGVSAHFETVAEAMAEKPKEEIKKAGPSINSVKEFMDTLFAYEIYDVEDDLDDIVTKLGSDLAKEFVFGYYGKEDMGDVDFPIWVITPKALWDNDGVIQDHPAPIHALLPNDADDVNDCMNWTWTEDLNPADRAKDLVKRGFIWDETLQSAIQSEEPSDKADINSVVKAMKEGRPKNSLIKKGLEP